MVELDFAQVVGIPGRFLRRAIQKCGPFPGRHLLSPGIRPVQTNMPERPSRRAQHMGFWTYPGRDGRDGIGWILDFC